MNLLKGIIPLFFIFQSLHAQEFIKGIIAETDSSGAMPFVFIINKSNGNGTMSDNNGRFSIYTGMNDTLICSFVGYSKQYIPVNSLMSPALAL